MAHTIIATIAIKAGKKDEAATALKTFAAWIKDNEPGTIHYFVHPVKGKDSIVVYERYESKDAFKIHSKHLLEQAGALMPLLAGGIDIVELDDA